MRISVVTPTFNYGRFLPKCLESVYLQVRVDGDLEIEHWVVDGGSTDGTVEFLQSWRSSHPESSRYSFHWSSEPDNGQTDAINKGLRKATGDLVCWLNADEYYLPGKLSLVVEAFRRCPNTDFLYGESLFVRKDGSPIRVKPGHWFSKFVIIHFGCIISSCCLFWRKRVLEDGHFLDATYRVVMDGEFFARLACLGYRFRFIPHTLACYSLHGDNISSVQDERRLFEEKEIRRKYGRVPFCFDGALRCFSHFWHRVLVLFRYVVFPVERG